jgi:hypothetical protein
MGDSHAPVYKTSLQVWSYQVAAFIGSNPDSKGF